MQSLRLQVRISMCSTISFPSPSVLGSTMSDRSRAKSLSRILSRISEWCLPWWLQPLPLLRQFHSPPIRQERWRHQQRRSTLLGPQSDRTYQSNNQLHPQIAEMESIQSPALLCERSNLVLDPRSSAYDLRLGLPLLGDVCSH